MHRILLALVLVIAPASLAARQDPGWTEIRFTRVHLRNGNFVDGGFVRQNEREIVLMVKAGEMTIRLDSVTKVEMIKMRTRNEKPAELEIRKQPDRIEPEIKGTGSPEKDPVADPPSRPETPSGERAPTRAPTVSVDPGAVDASVSKTVDEILERVRLMPQPLRQDVMKEIAQAGKDALPYLASKLETMDDETLLLAINTLSETREPNCVPVLLQLLRSKRPAMRAHIATLMGVFSGSEIVANMHPLLGDKDRAVRRAAIGTLQKIGTPQSFDRVASLCLDSDRAVRLLAVGALTAIASRHDMKEELAAALTQCLERAKGEVAVELLNGVAQAGRKESWQLLAQYLTDDVPAVRAAAASALGTLNVPESGDSVADRLSLESDKRVLMQLSVAVQTMKLRQAIEPLIQLLSEPDLDIRLVYTRALRTITGQAHGDDQSKWQEWWAAVKPQK